MFDFFACSSLACTSTEAVLQVPASLTSNYQLHVKPLGRNSAHCSSEGVNRMQMCRDESIKTRSFLLWMGIRDSRDFLFTLHVS